MLNRRNLLTLAATAGGALLSGGLARPALAQARQKVTLGYAPWADAEFVTKLAAKLMRDRLNVEPALMQSDIAPLYQGITRGDVDAMLQLWLPETHADYWKRIESKVDRLGVLYTDAKLGWVVPSYVPKEELDSFADLKSDEVREKLGGIVQGIEPGAGLTRVSREALKTYGLGDMYRLQESSEAAMISMIERSMRRKKWVVATAWSPHWMFGKYDLRYLADPEKAMGGTESVYAIARKGLKEQSPGVTNLLTRMNLPLDELQKAMLDAQETSYDKAVENYIASHKDRVESWLKTA
ncbi:glycine betaine ABC transporter substrate-binding protein [Roseomonas gilardii subsp. gilardii]|uniref:glycine betaine ABC transporter substrate-binding protein n=1 Tax=Roseomonas gilardii TaxID=257708 RepID=UPI001FFC147E|nr:glycine betaine ABC transporter substrate-binding protein [Roseomonas gilardii]UPG72760.1 glycine betaine ABC transporter substrate-binding protein [Roseomonas gilardii subsp. gilardii]